MPRICSNTCNCYAHNLFYNDDNGAYKTICDQINKFMLTAELCHLYNTCHSSASYTGQSELSRRMGWRYAVKQLIPRIYCTSPLSVEFLYELNSTLMQFSKRGSINHVALHRQLANIGKRLNPNSVRYRIFAWNSIAKQRIAYDNLDSLAKQFSLLLDCVIDFTQLEPDEQQKQWRKIFEQYSVVAVLVDLNIVADANAIDWDDPVKIYIQIQLGIAMIRQFLFDSCIRKEDMDVLSIWLLIVLNKFPHIDRADNQNAFGLMIFILHKLRLNQYGNGRMVRILGWYFAAKTKLLTSLDVFSRNFWMCCDEMYQMDANNFWIRHELPKFHALHRRYLSKDNFKDWDFVLINTDVLDYQHLIFEECPNHLLNFVRNPPTSHLTAEMMQLVPKYIQFKESQLQLTAAKRL